MAWAMRCFLVAILLILPLGTMWADTPAPPYLKLSDTLRDIHNQGAGLFNAGDPAAAYYLFQGALQAVEPVLSSRPDVQKTIDNGLSRAKEQPSMRERAWALHEVIETVRQHIKPGQPGGTSKEPPVAPTPRTKPRLPVPAATLWHDLGGEKTVRQVVDDFVALAAKDSKVAFTWHGKNPLTDAQIAHLKEQLVALISDVSGGPLHYSGKAMREAHRGMPITNAEFDALVADLKQALEKNHVAAAVAQKLLAAIENTRHDIVEPAGTSKQTDKKEAGQKH